MTKPSDFYIGVIEFFGVFLPGASLTYLLQPYLKAEIPVIWLPGTSSQGWVIFAVAAYVAGHLLHALGSWLLDNYVYNKFYLPIWQRAHQKASSFIRKGESLSLRQDGDASMTLLGRVALETQVDPRGSNYYDWCLSTIRLNAPVGASEVDRIQADSKFFRSMVLVFSFAALFCVAENRFDLLLSTMALVFFSTWRFCILRWAATKRVYEYCLLAEKTDANTDL